MNLEKIVKAAFDSLIVAGDGLTKMMKQETYDNIVADTICKIKSDYSGEIKMTEDTEKRVNDAIKEHYKNDTMHLEEIIRNTILKILVSGNGTVTMVLPKDVNSIIDNAVCEIKAEVLDYIMELNKLNQPLTPVAPVNPITPNPCPTPIYPTPIYPMPINPWYPPYWPNPGNIGPWACPPGTVYYNTGSNDVTGNVNCTGKIGCQCPNCKPKGV